MVEAKVEAVQIHRPRKVRKSLPLACIIQQEGKYRSDCLLTLSEWLRQAGSAARRSCEEAGRIHQYLDGASRRTEIPESSDDKKR